MEKILDTVIALMRQRMGMEPPYFKDTVSRDATKIGNPQFAAVSNQE
jgi:hypothetical protein